MLTAIQPLFIDCTSRLAVFVKITASRSSYLFLQQTVTNSIISAKQSNQQKFEAFNFMQNKKRLIANILKDICVD